MIFSSLLYTQMSETQQEVNGKSQTPENETSGKKTDEKPREPPIVFKDLDVSFDDFFHSYL